MSKKISLGVAATIAIIAMAVTFSLTMVVSMKMFNTSLTTATPMPVRVPFSTACFSLYSLAV